MVPRHPRLPHNELSEEPVFLPRLEEGRGGERTRGKGREGEGEGGIKWGAKPAGAGRGGGYVWVAEMGGFQKECGTYTGGGAGRGRLGDGRARGEGARSGWRRVELWLKAFILGEGG